MPFVKKINVGKGILGIWELSESIGTLISAFRFSENEKAEFEQFKFEKRQKEYLSTRLLLQHLLKEKTEITYQNSGRPQIKNSTQNISISHSSDFVVIFISNHLVGVDIENVNRNIDKVAKRFLHHDELSWIEQSENQHVLKIIFWCAKEAIFKCSNKTGVQFDTQIFISPVNFMQTDSFKGFLTSENQPEHYDLWYIYFRNNIIVYCVDDKNKN